VDTETKSDGRAVPWNKGKLLGQKPPLKLREIWAIRIRLQLTHRHREPALFNLAIDSKVARVRFGWASRIRRRTGHSRRSPLRRTKATMIYRRTRNLRAVQLLLGHTKLESTVRYLGIEIDDALEIAEQNEV
jgi:site-specific recombinase XerC